MVNKAVIPIDIDPDGAFKRFYEQFVDYNKKLSEMPEGWRKVDAAVNRAGRSLQNTAKGASEAFDGSAEALDDIEGGLNKAAKAGGEFSKEALTASDALAIIATSTALIVEAIREAANAQKAVTAEVKVTEEAVTRLERAANRSHRAMSWVGGSTLGAARGAAGFLMRLAPQAFAMSALAGALGGFGMGALSGSAAGQSRVAGGMGLTTGQRNAFNVNLGQYVSGGLLSGVAGAQFDPQQAWKLSVLGINPQAAAGEGANVVAIQAYNAAMADWKRNHNAQTAAIHAYQGLGGQIADLRYGARQPGGLIRSREAAALRDSGSLGFSDDVGREWTQLNIQLHKAGVLIESTLIKGLSGLAGPLGNLSGAVSKALAAFLSNPDLKKWLDQASVGLETLATYVGSPEFSKGVKSFIENVSDMADTLERVAKKIGVWFPAPPDPYQQAAAAASGGSQGSWFNRSTNKLVAAGWRAAGAYSPGAIHAAAAAAEKKYNLPAGILDRLATAESSYGKNLFSSKGAIGPWQIEPGTADMLHIDPLNTPQAADGAGRYLALLRQHFGSWDKAVAAYNYGPGNLDADIKAHGDAWARYLPKDTIWEVGNVVPGFVTPGKSDSRELTRLLKLLMHQGRPNPTSITITNQTSAKVHVSANAAASG